MNNQIDVKRTIIAMQVFFLIIYVIVFFVNGSNILSLIPVFMINVIFMIVLLVNLKNGKLNSMMNPGLSQQDRIMIEELRMTPGFDPNNPDTYPPQYRQRLFELAGIQDPQTQYSQPIYEEQPVEPIAEQPIEESQSYEDRYEYINDNKIEVRCISEVPNTSFALIADGRICGYIGNAPSTFDVPAGMHQTQIMTNDVDRKVIFDKNVMFNTKKRFTIKKKIGGFSVIIE